MQTIFINTDGGSRGNPGPAGIGVVFYGEKGKVFYEYNKYIGEATNNEAEYEAIIKALEILHKSEWFTKNNGNGSKIVCRLDSKLVVEQLNGNFKIKQPHIQELVNRVTNVLREYNLSVGFIHIPREENKDADKLVNLALDEAVKAGMERK